MDLYQDYTVSEIRDELGCSYYSGEAAVSELKTAVMLLCNRIGEFEARIDLLRAAKEG